MLRFSTVLFLLLALALPLYAASSQLFVPPCPEKGAFSPHITNPWFPYQIGETRTYRGVENKREVILTVTVSESTKVIGNVTCRVIVETEKAGDRVLEISHNYLAQCADGSVCTFGEDVDSWEGGGMVSHEGSWHAGEKGAVFGVLVPATPTRGMTWAEEMAPKTAEDRAEVETLDDTLKLPVGTYTGVLRLKETSTLEKGAVDRKWFARGVGMVKDNKLELIKVEGKK